VAAETRIVIQLPAGIENVVVAVGEHDANAPAGRGATERPAPRRPGPPGDQ